MSMPVDCRVEASPRHSIGAVSTAWRSFSVHSVALAAGLLVPVGAIAQGTGVPVRPLPTPDAVSAPGVVRSIRTLRAVSESAVLINDPIARQVVLLDKGLRVAKVVADPNPSTGGLYGPYSNGMFAWRGDSTLFLNGATMAMAVIDGSGVSRRVMAAPSPRVFGELLGVNAGNPGFDGRGRLVFKGAGVTQSEQSRRGKLPGVPGPDSVPLVRFDFATRTLDTAVFVRAYFPRIKTHTQRRTNGDTVSVRSWYRPVLHPIPTVDDWALLPDGRIAVVRGSDYHVDVIDDDNRIVHQPKIPFAWRRLLPEDKAAFIDSSRALRARLIQDGVPVGYAETPPPNTETMGTPTVSVSTGTGAQSGVRPGSVRQDDAPEATYVDPDELPDYQPVFASGAVRADAEGHLWVRTIPPAPLSGGAIYDVLDRDGRLVDRVQVPRGTAIAGFAPKGVVFLAERRAGAISIIRVRHEVPVRN
jgi:hypothetical protein